MPFALTFMAGAIGTLSPCVLPVLPIVMGSTRQSGPLGPVVLAAGMIFSFTLVGFSVASFGYKVGITQETISSVAAVMLLIFGLVMFSSSLADFLTKLLRRFSERFANVSAKSDKKTYAGQFFTGILLGGIWSPCTGPTLGVAISLAASQKDLLRSFFLMATYGVGSALPLMLVAYFSRQFSSRRERIGNLAASSKKVFAIILIIAGLLMVTHLDKVLEGFLLDILPESFMNFLTKY